MDAVILAGGTDEGEIAAETGVVHRALLEVGGRLIIHRTVAALRGASEIGRVALVAPEPVQAAVGDEAVDYRVPAGDSFITNLVEGVAAAGAAEAGGRVLVLTGDLPFITAAAINDFAQQSERARAEVTYSIIPRESCERSFPGGRRTYVRLREGVFTGGNAVTLTREFVRQRRDLIERLFAARKSPLHLAGLLGLGFIIRLLTHRLDLPSLEAKAGAIVGSRVAAIISTYPELGFDVDKLDDLRLARRVHGCFGS